MTKRKYTPAYPAELRDRGVWLFQENRVDHASDKVAHRAIAPKLGCSPDSLRGWCQQAEPDSGLCEGLTTADGYRIKNLDREVRELRIANEIFKKSKTIFRHCSEGNGRTHFFCSSKTLPPILEMILFIDDHRADFGVGLICKALPIAPSTARQRKFTCMRGLLLRPFGH